MRVGTRITRTALSVALALAAAVAVFGEGSSTGRLRLLDADGRQVEPFGARGSKAVVLLFVRTDCPVSNRYAPEVERLYERFGRDGTSFWLVYCDPGESAAAIRAHLTEYGYRMGALLDPRHELVALAGARVTPEAAVFVPQGEGWRMAYRGRIDDRYASLGVVRPEPTTHDLERVLDSISRGTPPETTTTTAIGCYISDLR